FLAPEASGEARGSELPAELTRDAAPEAQACPPLSLDDVRLLSPHRFEALVAALEAAQRREVLLTPRSGDAGIGLEFCRSFEVLLIFPWLAAATGLAQARSGHLA